LAAIEGEGKEVEAHDEVDDELEAEALRNREDNGLV